MTGRLRLPLLLGIALSARAAPEADRPHFDLSRPEIRSFIDQVVKQDGLDRKQVESVLGEARLRPEVIDSMNRPAEKTLQWWEYRALFLTENRIEAGAALWREHRELLDEIAVERGVPPEYLVAITGVETRYGRTTGSYRVLDTLMTFAFEYPRRGDFYRKELEQYLLLTRESGIDPLTTLGSYGGAMGAAQFMPSSYRKFAVDRSGRGQLDLWSDWDDIFASVANWFTQHGWRAGAPTLADARTLSDKAPGVPERVSLDQTLGALRAEGLAIDSTLPDETAAALIGAPLENAMSYRVGFNNFMVILRYQGSSPLYAMAVCDLAGAIKARVLADEHT
jgi:membrane-bound lytic murein transglycosylase B